MNKITLASALLCTSALAMTGCQTVQNQLKTGNPLSQPVLKSVITTTDGNNTDIGQVYLRPVDNGIQVYGSLIGLQPGETVALHIHETGSCGNMGKEAGGHFNPDKFPHSNPNDVKGHAGDLPNVTADANGVAPINYVNKQISVEKNGKYSVNRLAFIVHSGADDYVSQPSGASGDRIGCGIIEAN